MNYDHDLKPLASIYLISARTRDHRKYLEFEVSRRVIMMIKWLTFVFRPYEYITWNTLYMCLVDNTDSCGLD